MADRQEVEQDVYFRSHGNGDYTYEPDTDDVQVAVTLKTGLYQEFGGAQKLRVNIQVVDDEGADSADDQGNSDNDTADEQETSDTRHDTAGKEAHKDTEQKHQPTKSSTTKTPAKEKS